MRRRLFFDQHLDATSGDTPEELLTHLVQDGQVIPLRGIKPGKQRSGFGLKKSSEQQVQKSTGSKEETRHLDIARDPDELYDQFCDWTGRQYQLSRTGHYAVYLTYGLISAKKQTALPVLWIPVQLVPLPDSNVFCICYDGGDFHYHPEIDQSGISTEQLPSLPSALEDIHFNNLYHDIRELLIPQPKISISEELQLHAASTEFKAPKTRQPAAGFGFSNKKQNAGKPDIPSLHFLEDPGFLPLLPPGSLTASLLTALRQGKTSTAFPATSSRECHESLVNLIVYGIQHNMPVILVSDDPDPQESVEEAMSYKKLNQAILPLYRIRNRRDWIKYLQHGIDAEWEDAQESPESYHPPQTAVNDLKKLETALCTPYGKMNQYPGQIAAKLRNSGTRPLFTLPLSQPSALTEKDMERYQELLKQYFSIRKNIGNEEHHPWRWVHTVKLSEEGAEELNGLWNNVNDILKNLPYYIKRICRRIGIDQPETPSDLPDFIEAMQVLQDSPQVDYAQFKVDWSSRPESVAELFSLVAKGLQQAESIRMYFNPEILQEDLLEKVPRLYEQSQKFSRYLNWSYQKEIEQLLNYGVNSGVEENGMFWHALFEAVELQKIRNRLEELKAEGQRLFGRFWQGMSSNIGLLEEQMTWLQTYQQKLQQYPILDSEKIRVFVSARQQFDLRELKQIKELKAELESNISRIKELLEADENNPFTQGYDQSWEEFRETIAGYEEHFDKLNSWLAWRLINDIPEAEILHYFLDRAAKQQVSKPKDLTAYFEHIFRHTLLEAVKSERPVLYDASSDFVEERLAQIWDSLRSAMSRSESHLKYVLKEKRSKAVNSDEYKPEIELLRHELQKYSRHRSIDHTINQTRSALFELFPVWLISYDQLDQLPDTKGALIVQLDPPEDTQDEVGGTSSNMVQIDRKFDNDNSASPFRVPHTVTLQAVDKSEVNSGQISRESISEILQKLIPEHSRPPAQYYYPFGKDTQKQMVSEVQQACERIPDCLQAMDSSTLKIHKMPVAGEQVPVIMDTSGIKTDEAQKHLTDIFNWGSATSDIKVYCNTDQLEKGLSKVVQTRGNPAGAGKKPANPIANTLPEHLGQDWHLIPSDQSPFTSMVMHKYHQNLVYATITRTGTDQKSLWDQYLELRPFMTPVFISALQYGADLENRLKALGNRLREDVRNIEASTEASKQQPLGFGLKRQASETDDIEEAEPESVVSSRAEHLPPVYPEVITELTRPIPSYPLEYPELKSRKVARNIELDNMPELPEYELHQGENMGTREDFLSANDDELRPLMSEIVETESPIHWRNLMRCYASYWQVQKLNENVETILFRIMAGMLEDEQIFAKDGCLYNNPDFLFKLRSRKSSLAYHHLEELPLDELEYALYALIKAFQPVDETDVMKHAAWYIGFPRLSPPLKYRMQTALGRMAHARVVGKARNGLMLV